MKSPKQKTLLIGLTVILLLLILSLIVTIERQNIYDWHALLGYHPSSTISELATQDGMKAYTRRVFYVNHPSLYPKTTFSSVCPNNSEQTVVLGCYRSGQQGIFLLEVNDPNLYGLEQVTAAYETLHAIYQRLSASSQAKLNSELVSFENNGLNNATVKTQIAGFRRSEPGEVLNEMTSLFGTEVQNLPPDLNAFYTQYFNYRQTLLNYYDSYQSAFTSRQQKMAAYNAELSTLNAQIVADKSSLAAQLSTLNQEQSTLNSESGPSQTTQYNQLVVTYTQQVDQYNALVDSLRSLVAQYNQIVIASNAIALQEQQLVQTITSPPIAQAPK